MAEKEQKTNVKNGFPWMKLIYSLIVIFLYVPLVFVGVRTFVPQYLNYYEQPFHKDCYAYIQYPDSDKCYDAEEYIVMVEKRDLCLDEQQADQKAYEEARRGYDTWRYLAILGVAVLTLIIMMFLAFDVPIKVGLFIGSSAAVFIATMQYFETKSIPAFIVLLIVFCIVVFLIQKRERFFKKV